jgi:hypothetical protein
LCESEEESEFALRGRQASAINAAAVVHDRLVLLYPTFNIHFSLIAGGARAERKKKQIEGRASERACARWCDFVTKLLRLSVSRSHESDLPLSRVMRRSLKALFPRAGA